jgi:hypothetical protein
MTIRDIWQRSLDEEIQFWQCYITTRGGQWLEEYQRFEAIRARVFVCVGLEQEMGLGNFTLLWSTVQVCPAVNDQRRDESNAASTIRAYSLT